jgi:hypothetical protein
MFTVPFSTGNSSTTKRSQKRGAKVQNSSVAQNGPRVKQSSQIQNGEHELLDHDG